MSARFVMPAWLAASTLLACDHRVVEPEPPPSAAVAEPREEARPEPVPSASSEKARCVRPRTARSTRAAAPSGSDPRCPADPTGNPELERGSVTIGSAGARVSVEIAERDVDRRRGLMYRTELAEDAGMLFVFEREEKLSFWMRNTCLPLDMLFLDREGFVVGIEENVPTMNDNSYGFDCPARYVLEVKAGWAKRHAIEPGQRARIAWPSP